METYLEELQESGFGIFGLEEFERLEHVLAEKARRAIEQAGYILAEKRRRRIEALIQKELRWQTEGF